MIYLKTIGGLCNRLRTISSILTVSFINKQNLTVIWNQDNEMNTNFSSLFKTNNIPFNLLENQYQTPQKPDVSYNNTQLKEYQDKQHPIYTIQQQDINKKTYLFSTCYQFSKQRDYSWLTPTQQIQEKIDFQLNSIKSKNYIGVHIRRTDNQKSTSCSPIDLFISKIQSVLKQDKTQRFYLCTDDPHTKQHLYNLFKPNIHTNFNQHQRQDKEGPQEALTDLITLSKSTYVIGSYWSSFSEESTRIRNIPLYTIYKE